MKWKLGLLWVILSLGIRVSGLGFRIQGVGFGVWGLGLKDFGLWVWCSRFKWTAGFVS